MATIVRVTCEGTRPLLMEPMSEETLEHLRRGTRPPGKKDIEPQKEAEGKLYRDPETGKLAMPADNFWASMVQAGTLVSYKGKRNISNAEESLLPGVLNIKEEYLPFTDGDGYRVDKRRGRLDNGTTICIVRPLFPKWGFRATLEIDDKFIGVEKIRELVETAGRFKGLGGFRKKGRFGRFQITSWEVLSNTAGAGGNGDGSGGRKRGRKPTVDQNLQSGGRKGQGS